MSIRKIAFIDLHVHFLGFRQHRDRDRRGMDAPLAFRRRHTLHPVHTRFVFQPSEDIAPGDFGGCFLDRAQAGVAVFQDLEFPAFAVGILLIHREQFGGEQTGFVAARGWADFQDRRARPLRPSAAAPAGFRAPAPGSVLSVHTVRPRPDPSSPDRPAAIRPRTGRVRRRADRRCGRPPARCRTVPSTPSRRPRRRCPRTASPAVPRRGRRSGRV